MWDGVTVKVKPTGELISLAKLKSRLRIDHADDDALLSDLLAGAIARIDGPNGIGVAMMKQTWRKAMDAFSACIVLPGAPVSAVASIKYIDVDGIEQTLDPANCRADLTREPVRVEPAYGMSWPVARDVIGAVVIEYDLGSESASEVAQDLIDAVCMIVGHRYANREAVIVGASVAELPLGAQWILKEHSRGVVAS